MYTREASALDLFTDSVRLMGDATMCAVMEFDRRLDPVVLEEAAQACLLAHPILHSRLVRGNGPAFWEMVEPARALRAGGGVRRGLSSPRHRAGRSVRAAAVPRAPAAETFAGMSSSSTLPMPPPMRSASRPSHRSCCRSTGRRAASARPKGGFPERDTLWTRGLSREGTPVPSAMRMIDPLWPDPFGTSRQPSSFHRECVSPPALEAVRAHVGALGGTLNDAVMAAYYLAMSDLTGHRGPMAVFFPVNLRQHLDDGSRVMSNQATNVCFTLEREAGEGMAEILPRVIEATAALKAGRIGIAEQVEMDANCDPEGRQIQQMVEQMAAHAGKRALRISSSRTPGRSRSPTSRGSPMPTSATREATCPRPVSSPAPSAAG